MRQKTIVLGSWGTALIVSAMYAILSVITFSNIDKLENDQDIPADKAILGSTLLSVMLIIVYFAFSACVLAGRWCSAEANTGVWYGAMSASTLCMSAIMLQASINADAFVGQANAFQRSPNWDGQASNVLRATYILGYLLVAVYLIFFFELLFCKKAFAPGPHNDPLYVNGQPRSVPYDRQ